MATSQPVEMKPLGTAMGNAVPHASTTGQPSRPAQERKKNVGDPRIELMAVHHAAFVLAKRG